MALNGSALGQQIKTALTAIATPTNPNELDQFAQALGQAIVDYLLANSIVVGVVQTGQGAGGTVQGKVT